MYFCKGEGVFTGAFTSQTCISVQHRSCAVLALHITCPWSLVSPISSVLSWEDQQIRSKEDLRLLSQWCWVPAAPSSFHRKGAQHFCRRQQIISVLLFALAFKDYLRHWTRNEEKPFSIKKHQTLLNFVDTNISNYSPCSSSAQALYSLSSS